MSGEILSAEKMVMKERTDEEIEVKVKELWAKDWGCVEQNVIEITRRDDYVDIKLHRMYEKPGLAFPQLNALAKFFDTMKIETESEYGHGGCESCDYGSEYGFVLRISPGDPFQNIGAAQSE